MQNFQPSILTKPERWIQKGAVVKVMSKALDGFYKQKGEIKEVTGLRAVVKLINGGKKAKFVQNDLETVIPQPGREIIVMKGELAKKTGILKEIRQKEFRVLCEVKLTDTESVESLFKFDEISKKFEKKKKEIPVKEAESEKPESGPEVVS